MIDPVTAHRDLVAEYRFRLDLAMRAGLVAAAVIGLVCAGVAVAGPAARGLLAYPAAIALMTAALSGLFLPAARTLARDAAARAAAVAAEAPPVHLLTATLALFTVGFGVLTLILAALALV